MHQPKPFLPVSVPSLLRTLSRTMVRQTRTLSSCLLVWSLVAALVSQNLVFPVFSAATHNFQDEKNFYLPPLFPFLGGSPPVVLSPPISDPSSPPSILDPSSPPPILDPSSPPPVGYSYSPPPTYGNTPTTPIQNTPPPSHDPASPPPVDYSYSPPPTTTPTTPVHRTPPPIHDPTASPPPVGYSYSPPPTHGTTPTTPVHHTPSHHGGHHHHHGSPPTNCGIPTPHYSPPKHVDPSPPPQNPSPAPPTGYSYNVPPPSGGGSPPTDPSSPPIILPPTTPGLPYQSPPYPYDPNSPPTGGTCDFWRHHPGIIWALFGWWGTTIGSAFGLTTPLSDTGAHLNLVQALSNTRTDGIGALYREATAALLNSMVNKHFPYTSSHVKDSFLAAVGSNKAAAAQARVFKLANEGHMKLRD